MIFRAPQAPEPLLEVLNEVSPEAAPVEQHPPVVDYVEKEKASTPNFGRSLEAGSQRGVDAFFGQACQPRRQSEAIVARASRP